MMNTVAAVAIAMNKPRWVCAPSARNASSGPYADEDSPSAPRPTQARNAASAMCWRVLALNGSSGLPMTRCRSFSYVVIRSHPARPGTATNMRDDRGSQGEGKLGEKKRFGTSHARPDAAPQHATDFTPGLVAWQGVGRTPAFRALPACRLC